MLPDSAISSTRFYAAFLTPVRRLKPQRLPSLLRTLLAPSLTLITTLSLTLTPRVIITTATSTPRAASARASHPSRPPVTPCPGWLLRARPNRPRLLRRGHELSRDTDVRAAGSHIHWPRSRRAQPTTLPRPTSRFQLPSELDFGITPTTQCNGVATVREFTLSHSLAVSLSSLSLNILSHTSLTHLRTFDAT